MAPTSPSGLSRRLPVFALVVCALAAVAAVVSFVQGAWPAGVVWILMVGLSSNTAWYYVRRDRLERAVAEANGADLSRE